MNDHILNVITQIIAYGDASVTDNPHQRSFDHTRRLQSLSIKNPRSDSVTVPSNSSYTVFDGIVSTGLLSGTTELSLSLVSSETSLYVLESTTASSFKTERSVSGIVECVVFINNNVLGEFTFTGADLSSVQVGDLMRIKGQLTHESGPYSFNPLNSGLWRVVSTSGSKVLATRLTGETFSGVNETVTDASTDVIFYADDKVQKGHKIEITQGFSTVSQKIYEISDVTPTKIYLVSASPLPNESSITYTSGAIVIYRSSKKIVYLECDQDAIVRFNSDTSDSNKLNPITPGNKDLPAFIHKYGDVYSCTIVNKSVNPMNIKFFMGE